MDAHLRDRLEELKRAYEATLEQMADPGVISDQDRYRELSIRHAELRPVVEAFEAYEAAGTEMAEAEELAPHEDDPEMRRYLEGVARETGRRVTLGADS